MTMKKEKYCKICGKPFVPRTNNHLCCSTECSKVNADRLRRKRIMERQEIEKGEKVKLKEIKMKTLSIAKINELARQEHCSYGQYCGKHGI